MKKPIHQHPEEMFEVYDGKGRKVGLARRAEVHGNPALIHRVAHVLVFNSRGELYLQKRAENKDVQPGKWDTSVGGHLNIGETFLKGAKRELAEELGVTARLEMIHLYDYPWRSEIESEDVRSYAVVYDGEVRPDPEEISEGRFWTMQEIEKALGTGIFTPNFELELAYYREWRKMQTGR